MPILTRAIDTGELPKPLEHVVACVSCSRESTTAVTSQCDGELGVRMAVANARASGWRTSRVPEHGLLPDYICPKCAGFLF